MKYADIPYAYDASVDVVVHGIPVDVKLLEDMILDTGRDVLARIANDLETRAPAVVGTTWTYAHRGGAMTTTIEWTAGGTHAVGLDRCVVMSPPSEIYRAEPEFHDVLGKIREKAQQRQAERGSGELRGLSVDVHRTGIDYELETGRISLDIQTAAKAKLDLEELGLDFIALTLPRRGKTGTRRGVRAAVLFEETRITTDQLRQLYDLP